MEQSIRLTKRRSLVLDILREHGHLDAYELLEMARKKDSGSALRRCIVPGLFPERDVIHGRTFGEGHTHFEIHDAERAAMPILSARAAAGSGDHRPVHGDLEQLAKKEKFRISRSSRHVRALRRVCCQRTQKGFGRIRRHGRSETI